MTVLQLAELSFGFGFPPLLEKGTLNIGHAERIGSTPRLVR